MPLSIGLVCGVGWVGKWSGLGCIAFLLGFRVGREVLPVGQVGGYRVRVVFALLSLFLFGLGGSAGTRSGVLVLLYSIYITYGGSGKAIT